MRRPDSLPVTILLTVLVALGPISTDLYLPSLPSLMQYFDASEADVQLTLSVFLVGLAASQLVYGPLSDRFGRKPVLLAGLVLYLLASIACMLAPSIDFLIAARFFQALGACVGPVLCRAVVRDVHGREGAARVLSYLAAAMARATIWPNGCCMPITLMARTRFWVSPATASCAAPASSCVSMAAIPMKPFSARAKRAPMSWRKRPTSRMGCARPISAIRMAISGCRMCRCADATEISPFACGRGDEREPSGGMMPSELLPSGEDGYTVLIRPPAREGLEEKALDRDWILLKRQTGSGSS
jgi:MFS family permease